MQNKKNNIAAFILTILIITVGIKFLGYILRPTDTDSAYTQVESFHSLPSNSVDVVIYGSSHAFRCFDARELYNNFGIAAYDYSWNWQKINTTRAFFEDSLEKQKPKVILIETYLINEVLEDVDINAEIYYSRYLHSKEAKKEFLTQCFGSDIERYVSYYIPLYAFHDNWIDLTKNSFSFNLSKDRYLKTMGYAESNDNYIVHLTDQNTVEQEKLSENAINELDKIVKKCKENNIDIIFYTIPYEGEYHYSDAMKEYADFNGYKYFNLFEYIDDVGIDCNTDFSDDDHLNVNGAKKVANFFGEYLSNNYDLKDIRKDDNNIWKKYINN